MRNRGNKIFLLTHGYPIFIILHLYFGDWCRRCQVMYAVAPILCFGGLLYIWLKTSREWLQWSEKFNVAYLIYIMTALAGYYILCIYSLPKWVYDHNVQMAAFIFLTAVFYLLFYRKLKRCEP